MPPQLLKISVEELVKKILAGERDFERIVLPEGANLSEHIPELNEYLRQQNLQENPLNLRNSKLIRVVAPKIYIPYSNLSIAVLSGAVLITALT